MDWAPWAFVQNWLLFKKNEKDSPQFIETDNPADIVNKLRSALIDYHNKVLFLFIFVTLFQ